MVSPWQCSTSCRKAGLVLPCSPWGLKLMVLVLVVHGLHPILHHCGWSWMPHPPGSRGWLPEGSSAAAAAGQWCLWFQLLGFSCVEQNEKPRAAKPQGERTAFGCPPHGRSGGDQPVAMDQCPRWVPAQGWEWWCGSADVCCTVAAPSHHSLAQAAAALSSHIGM